VQKTLVGTALALLGGALAFVGLVRLGWRRHGAPAADASFLHLDWLTEPSRPAWRAHVENLALLLGGLLLAAVGLALLALAARARLARRKHGRGRA
jgi:hypothetical protein